MAKQYSTYSIQESTLEQEIELQKSYESSNAMLIFYLAMVGSLLLLISAYLEESTNRSLCEWVEAIYVFYYAQIIITIGIIYFGYLATIIILLSNFQFLNTTINIFVISKI